MGTSLANDFHQDALVSAAVKLPVKDLFPGTEIKFAVRNCDYDFPAHYLAFVMRVAVVFAGAIVMITLRAGIERRQPFQPPLVVFVKTRLVIINEHARSD